VLSIVIPFVIICLSGNWTRTAELTWQRTRLRLRRDRYRGRSGYCGWRRGRNRRSGGTTTCCDGGSSRFGSLSLSLLSVCLSVCLVCLSLCLCLAGWLAGWLSDRLAVLSSLSQTARWDQQTLSLTRSFTHTYTQARVSGLMWRVLHHVSVRRDHLPAVPSADDAGSAAAQVPG
jgi:hypothetical protein